jgi:hypothetical protein
MNAANTFGARQVASSAHKHPGLESRSVERGGQLFRVGVDDPSSDLTLQPSWH